jgi:hypothetical protein
MPIDLVRVQHRHPKLLQELAHRRLAHGNACDSSGRKAGRLQRAAGGLRCWWAHGDLHSACWITSCKPENEGRHWGLHLCAPRFCEKRYQYTTLTQIFTLSVKKRWCVVSLMTADQRRNRNRNQAALAASHISAGVR